MKYNLFTIHNIDIHYISSLIDNPIVNVTITSTPYFDL